MGDMTNNFSRKEFECGDGCGLDKIDPDLVDNLQHSRDSTGIPYVIESGCRCESHNRRVGGVPDSAHLLKFGRCKAVDIRCVDILTRKRMIADFVRRFRHIGIAKSFIHVDNDSSKPEGIYLY